MIDGPRFIIFSLPRSGSTTLAGLLDCHPQIRCVNEPFNPANRVTCAARAVDKPSFDAALREIWAEGNGIKHVWDFGLQISSTQRLQDRELLTSGAKVILLNRRNRLRRLVSVEISNQSGAWVSTSRARERNRSVAFKDLDIDTLQWALEAQNAAAAEHRSLLEHSGREFIECWYEDLFGEAKTARECMERLAEILSFLGLAMLDAKARAAAESLFDPRFGKVNSAEIYRRIPNIAEVERRLGSDEGGWLFR